MYGGNIKTNTYSKLIKINKTETPVLSSLVERCQRKEVDKEKIQESWVESCRLAVNSIAEVNPYLPEIVAGDEVSAFKAATWVNGSRGGLDCRPKVFDGVSKTYKLCDTGSMVTVVKKSETDKIDFGKTLKAVNGSSIAVYGQKEIYVRLGRKHYKIDAIIADVEQDILGWDFFNKYRLDRLID